MAITVFQTTDDHAPCGSPMWCMITGSQSSVTGFLYSWYVDIDTASTGFTNVSLVKQHKRPDGYGVYDPRLVIKDYVPYPRGDIQLTEYGITRDPSYIIYRVRAGEYQNSTQLTAPANVKATGFAFIGVVKVNDFPDWDITDYELTDSTTKFLTNSPRTLSIYSSQHAWLYFLQNSTSADKVRIVTYNSTGGTVGSYDIANSYTDTGVDQNHYLRVNAGTYQINQVPSGSITVVSGALPILSSGVTKYEVTLRKTAPDSPRSETVTFNIDDALCKYTNIRLHWVNRFGKIDSFNFPLLNRKNVTIERRSYQQPLGTRTGSSFGYSRSDRGKSEFFIRSIERLRISSDWVSDAEAVWLQELFESPAVYQQTDASTILSVNMVTDSLEVKKQVNDGVINYTFEIEYSNANE